MPVDPIAPITANLSANQERAKQPIEEFKEFLAKAIQEVDAKHKKSEELVKKVATGEAENLHEVMIALEEADVALQLTLQIRNKIVEAYQEISRMQV